MRSTHSGHSICYCYCFYFMKNQLLKYSGCCIPAPLWLHKQAEKPMLVLFYFIFLWSGHTVLFSPKQFFSGEIWAVPLYQPVPNKIGLNKKTYLIPDTREKNLFLENLFRKFEKKYLCQFIYGILRNIFSMQTNSSRIKLNLYIISLVNNSF